MNTPPTEFVRVAPEPMQSFVSAIFQKVGLREEDAELLATLLTRNDLRGVFSHGTRQTESYVAHYERGELNPRPEVKCLADVGSTAVFDGDGGLGYFPSWRAAHLVAEKCKTHGIAAATTRNHGHFGAAGIYSRVALAHGFIGYATSGHQLELSPQQSLVGAAGGSPMSFAIPAGSEPPFVLDFGAMHDLYVGSPNLDEIVRLGPSTFFRSFGLGCVCQMIGGFLGGVPLGAAPGETPPQQLRRWSGANQGSFIVAIDIERFYPRDEFIARVDEFIRRTRQMQPVPGFEKSSLAGALEWEREQEWSTIGIPVSERHQHALARVAERYGVTPPWS